MAPVWVAMLVLTCLVLALSPTRAHLNDTIYAVAVNVRTTRGVPQTLCAHVLNPTERVLLRVTMQSSTGSRLVLEESVAEDYYRCTTFQVPLTFTWAVVNVAIQGEKDILSKDTVIYTYPPDVLHLILTDKPLYKPGQTVQFRIVSMDTWFIPVNQLYKTVEITDPEDNLIAQWRQRSAIGGILDLSQHMSSGAAQGSYTINARKDDGDLVSRSFDITDYDLPKYAVNIRLPDIINILDKEAPMQICGRYPYGKPVVGSITAVVCRMSFRLWGHEEKETICLTSQLQTDKTGCATHVIMVSAFAPSESMYRDMFEVEAEMEEHGTGVVIKASGQTPFSVYVGKVTFEYDGMRYKPGVPFEGKIKVSDVDGKALGGVEVSLAVRVDHRSFKMKLLTLDDGRVSFSLNTSLWRHRAELEAQTTFKGEHQPSWYGKQLPRYRTGLLHVQQLYPKIKSYVKITGGPHSRRCGVGSEVRAEYMIQGAELKPGQTKLHFHYIVTSKGGTIMRHGHLPVAVKEGIVKGVLSFPLLGKTAMSPYAQVVVYALMPSGTALADGKTFEVDHCFQNKVNLEFSADRVLAGGETTLSLETQPGSMCSVRVVDQSILRQQPDQELSLANVFKLLPWPNPIHEHPGYIDKSEPYVCFGPNDPDSVEEPPGLKRNDVYAVFRGIGLQIVSNSEVKKPCSLNPDGMDTSVDYDPLEGTFETPPRRITIKPVKRYFPETWIWDLIPVGESGKVSVVKTLPDRITSWAAQAFCSSPLGFGLSRDVTLVASRPFLLNLTLPSSVVRGEVFTLSASVFNALPGCIMVKAHLTNSSHFSSRECPGCRYTMCVCAEESQTFQWRVRPSSLGEVTLQVHAEAVQTEQLCGTEVTRLPTEGRVRTLERRLLVEAEGTPVAVTHNALLCPGEKPAEKNISLLLPEMVVAGSAKASFSVLGDLMGRALKNLDGLLAMPHGSGEQSMILFAPNIYILNYLKSTAQLTPAIRKRVARRLESGYQRLLTYRCDDGSYSAFGRSDTSGNIWLTAFVMKSFGSAKPFILIEPGYVSYPREWLLHHRRPDGCIRPAGKLFHNGMKGGVSDEVSLTAYITAALLELDAKDRMVSGLLQCLRVAVGAQLENMYTTALLSYTFTLAGDQQTRMALLTALHQHSITDGAMRHWRGAGASEKVLDSLEVETTAYVLLALLSGPPVPGFHLDYASSLVRWLIQQQNPYGGFSSTQDTVVALQALAKYAAATYTPQGSSVVGVRSPGGADWRFSVDQSTRLLDQEQVLDRLPGEYSLTAQGRGCVQAQIALRYNIPPPGDFSAFHLLATTTAVCNTTRPTLSIRVEVRYQGRREETNMLIINLKLLSGYGLQRRSLQALKSESTVKRVDLEGGYMNIYLDGLKNKEMRSFNVTLEEEEAVRNLKPAVVKVYDFYQTSDGAMADYTSPCSESDNVD